LNKFSTALSSGALEFFGCRFKESTWGEGDAYLVWQNGSVECEFENCSWNSIHALKNKVHTDDSSFITWAGSNLFNQDDPANGEITVEGTNTNGIQYSSKQIGNLTVNGKMNINGTNILDIGMDYRIATDYKTNIYSGVGANIGPNGYDWLSIGTSAGNNANGHEWVAIGKETGTNVIGNQWVAVGPWSAEGAAGGYFSSFGPAAGQKASGDRWNAFGYVSGRFASGNGWLACGQQAGQFSTGNTWNAFGYLAGRECFGDNWSSTGYQAGRNRTGSRWTALGYYSGSYSSGDDSLNLGNFAGRNGSGDARIYIDTMSSDPGTNYNPENSMIYGIGGDVGTLYLGRTNGATILRGAVSYYPVPALTNPVAGQIYFSSDDAHFYGYNGSVWKQLDN